MARSKRRSRKVCVQAPHTQLSSRRTPGPIRRGLRNRHKGRRLASTTTPRGLVTACAGTTVRHASSFPRRVFTWVLQIRCPSLVRGRRESRAPTAPAAPCAKGSKNAHGFDRYSRDIPAFPAQWFYGLCRALPGERPLLPPSRSGPYHPLDARVAAPGPHGFAVRCKRFVGCKHLTPQRPSQPAPIRM